MRVKNALGPNIHIQTFDIRTANGLNNCVAYTASAITNLYRSPVCASSYAQGHVTAEPHAANLATQFLKSFAVSV